MHFFRFLLLAIFAAWSTLASAVEPGEGGPVIVFAAASMKDALDAAAAEWKKRSGQDAKISYAASSALAKQIEQDAPAQIFISADIDWMDYLERKGFIKQGSRIDFLGNSLVLIGSKDRTFSVDLSQRGDLAKGLAGGRLAVGSVDSVPAGKYAKAALESLNIWASVSDKLAQAESVRAALLLVSRGEAPLGIVYGTDAASDGNVRVVATFPANSHPPIVYPMALTTRASDAARALYEFLKSAGAAQFFQAQGFTLLKSNAE
jgi:molybdate transport system substrate-binding protein